MKHKVLFWELSLIFPAGIIAQINSFILSPPHQNPKQILKTHIEYAISPILFYVCLFSQ